MSILSRFANVFNDNPATVNRGAAKFSGPMVAIAGVLLNVLILSLISPFLSDPDDRSFRSLTESLGFGGLLSLILLGGILVIATLLIPLRLVTVFMGPRIGRYFDQIVLSGISPFRFLIGNVTAQFFLIGLLLFLMLPHFVLAITFGGFHPGVFIGCLILVVLYCLMLSLCHLWLTLYFNELVAGFTVVAIAFVCGGIGAVPAPVQPMLMTPVPAILQPVYASMPNFGRQLPFETFAPVFLGCCLCMSLITCLAAFGLYLGPLYGIVKANSTFGEVVKAGDASKRRRFRFRLHIQRPSEIAFLYQNRSHWPKNSEGLVRWGLGLLFVLIVTAVMESVRTHAMVDMSGVTSSGPNFKVSNIYPYYILGMIRHGFTLLVSIFLFSHSRNTTPLKVSVLRGRRMTVGRLDSCCFVLCLLLSSGVNIVSPWLLESSGWLQNQCSLFPSIDESLLWGQVSIPRLQFESTLALSLCSVTLYLLQRWLCQSLWMKLMAFIGVTCIALVIFCGMPLLPLAIIQQLVVDRESFAIQVGAAIAMISPPFQFMLIGGEQNYRIPFDRFSWVFYTSQCLVIVFLIFVIRKGNRRLENELLDADSEFRVKTNTVSLKGPCS